MKSETPSELNGRGEPVLLLHGITGSAAMWNKVEPLLRPRFQVTAPTAFGHRGGSVATLRPARIQHVVDDAERLLDKLRIERAHLTGNSLGGWVALELARRDRALSVCALSPAGFWTEQPRAVRVLAAMTALTRFSRPLLPLLTHSAHFRRFALRDNAVHGERVTREELLAMADDVIGCSIAADLFTSPECFSALTPRCPVTIAWCEHDRIFPMRAFAPLGRQLVANARHTVLEGVGHVPMFDDPQLVADTIVESIEWAAASAQQTTPSATAPLQV
jgi:pimeloyl-ACP methyl ester carboxylesterase